MKQHLNTLFIIILFCLSTPYPTLSQSWEWQNPLPQGNDINAIDFVDREHGWLGCDGGVLLHTMDGGQTWELQSTGNQFWMNDIDFIDTDHGWAVGAYGIMARTSDGGESWEFDTLWGRYIGETPNDLNAVTFINTDYGWICGNLGTILHTRDGGITWDVQKPPVSTWKMHIMDYYKIYFIDNLKGWALGKNAFLWTEDGGENWQMDTTIVSMYCTPTNNCIWIDMGFWDNVHGWVLSSTGVFLKTEDGGISWNEVCTSCFGDVVTDGFFPDPHHGWVVSEKNYEEEIYYTESGGNTWVQLNSESNDIYRLYFFDDLNGFGITSTQLTSGNYKFYRTSDGGITWQDQTHIISEETSSFTGVQAINENTCIVIGRKKGVSAIGEIFKTTNGGETWSSLYSGNLTWFWDICFVTPDSGWVVGSASKILFTADGGSSWVEQNSNYPYRLWAVDFTDSRHGWAAGGDYFDGGVILHTSDGGLNWSIQWREQVVGKSMVFDVDFIDSQNGWAVNRGGDMLHTSDGGKHWYPQGSGSKIYVGVITFLDHLHGWGIGGNGVFKTNDGGETWALCSSGHFENYFTDLHFIDTCRGWASGSFGRLAYTEDGGITWVPQDSKTKHSLRALSFCDDENGWAVGDRGAILHTTDSVQTSVKSVPINENLPERFCLHQNYPNPFNMQTTIQYDLPESSDVELTVFDVQGRIVRRLVDEHQTAGYRTVTWSGIDEYGKEVASGLYLLRIRYKDNVKVCKIMLTK